MISETRSLNITTFKQLVDQGYNCKEIAHKMGWHSHTFGLKMKKILGIYPSVYIARSKNDKT